MKLLIVTQTVDSEDSVLGFFHRWIEEFSKHCESVVVICLREGKHELPRNVSVYSLGKEHGTKSGFDYAYRFFDLIWSLRKEYDNVFVHMNPEYIVLGGIFWRIWRKKVGLWYLHKSVDLKLRTAVLFANVIFTASKESFRLKSRKVRVVGHGIEAENFLSDNPANSKRFVTVGRISRSKNLETLIDVMAFLPESSLDIYGATHTPEDRDYLLKLEEKINESGIHDRILFAGTVSHEHIPEVLSNYGLFLHASSGTGSLDKAVLEAIAASVPVISSSIAFRELLQPHGLFVESGNAEDFAKTAEQLLERSDREAVAAELHERIRVEHSLQGLIPKILSAYAK